VEGPLEAVRDILDDVWHNHGGGTLTITAASDYELPEVALEIGVMRHRECVNADAAYIRTKELQDFFEAHLDIELIHL
jgi:hypothetical protein